MTLQDLLEHAGVLLTIFGGVGVNNAVKNMLGPEGVATVRGKRILYGAPAALGLLVGVTGFLPWPDVPQRLVGGLLLGLATPTLYGFARRRVPK